MWLVGLSRRRPCHQYYLLLLRGGPPSLLSQRGDNLNQTLEMIIVIADKKRVYLIHEHSSMFHVQAQEEQKVEEGGAEVAEKIERHLKILFKDSLEIQFHFNEKKEFSIDCLQKKEEEDGSPFYHPHHSKSAIHSSRDYLFSGIPFLGREQQPEPDKERHVKALLRLGGVNQKGVGIIMGLH